MRHSEAERCFREEVREKKKAASGVHHKTGKRGYVGKMLFPSDIMSRKEKYNYRKAGKVMTSNMYDQILTKDEFMTLETHEQRNRLAYWRTQNTNNVIKDAMGMHNQGYYALVKELGLSAERKPRTNVNANTTEEKPKKMKEQVAAIAIEPQLQEVVPTFVQESPVQTLAATQISIPTSTPTPIQEIIVDGLHVAFSGTYSAEKIEKQLTKFMRLFEGEDNEFYIELKIVQK